jgi:hypothetical protein
MKSAVEDNTTPPARDTIWFVAFDFDANPDLIGQLFAIVGPIYQAPQGVQNPDSHYLLLTIHECFNEQRASAPVVIVKVAVHISVHRNVVIDQLAHDFVNLVAENAPGDTLVRNVYVH